MPPQRTATANHSFSFSLRSCLDKFLYLDFTTEQIKLPKNPFNSARKKGPNWINYHIQDSFEGQRYLTSKIDKFIEDYK